MWTLRLDLQCGYSHRVGGETWLFHRMGTLESKDPRGSTGGAGDEVLSCSRQRDGFPSLPVTCEIPQSLVYFCVS